MIPTLSAEKIILAPYCTDAVTRLIRYGFEDFPLNKIHAQHLAVNPASGRVMQKSGMTQEGFLRQHVIKDGVALDLVEYGILRNEFAASTVWNSMLQI